MKTFKVLFLNGIIDQCIELADTELKFTSPYWEEQNGELSFVLIKTPNDSQARSIAKYIALELRHKNALNKQINIF